MKAGDSIGPGWVVRSRVRGADGTLSYLVSESSRQRSPRHLLKWLDPAAKSSPLLASALLASGGELRPDFTSLCSLTHPSLCLPITYGFEADGGSYIIRPYAPGSDLASAAQDRDLPDVLPWLIGAAEALAWLHRFGHAHENLRPENIIVLERAMYTQPREGPLVAICDPLLRRRGEDSDATPVVRARLESDLLDLGRSFRRALTGSLATNDGRFEGIPITGNASLSMDLERILHRLMHPIAESRYSSASELARDLRSISETRVPMLPVPDCFVGREAELELAIDCVGRAAAADCVAVVGEAGMGKSTFLRRLSLESQLLGYRVCQVRCYSETAASPAPLDSLAQQLASYQDRPKSFRARYRRLMKARGSRPEVGSRRSLLRGLLDFFLTAAGDRPTLLVFDEVHVSDPFTVGVPRRDDSGALRAEERGLAPFDGLARSVLSHGRPLPRVRSEPWSPLCPRRDKAAS